MKKKNILYITQYDGLDDQAEYIVGYINRIIEEYHDIEIKDKAYYEYSEFIEGSIVYIHHIPTVVYIDYVIYPGDYIVENYDGLIYVVPADLGNTLFTRKRNWMRK